MHFFSHFGVWKWQKYLAAHFGGNIINRQMCNSFAQKKKREIWSHGKCHPKSGTFPIKIIFARRIMKITGRETTQRTQSDPKKKRQQHKLNQKKEIWWKQKKDKSPTQHMFLPPFQSTPSRPWGCRKTRTHTTSARQNTHWGQRCKEGRCRPRVGNPFAASRGWGGRPHATDLHSASSGCIVPLVGRRAVFFFQIGPTCHVMRQPDSMWIAPLKLILVQGATYISEKEASNLSIIQKTKC